MGWQRGGGAPGGRAQGQGVQMAFGAQGQGRDARQTRQKRRQRRQGQALLCSPLPVRILKIQKEKYAKKKPPLLSLFISFDSQSSC